MNFSDIQIKLRKSADRGFVRQGWLQSYHSFSFTGYYDPAHMHYSVLRVINEDVFDARQGFGMHPHKNMEIITYILQGELLHEDSLGNKSVLRIGDVQCMTAGSGVVHSEINASDANPVHLLQIWILPESKLLEPAYTEKNFSESEKRGRWCLIVSADGREKSLRINQDVSIFATILAPEEKIEYKLYSNRSVYIQLAKGEIEVCGHQLKAGDAIMFDGEFNFIVRANVASELLLFDLPIHRSIEFNQ